MMPPPPPKPFDVGLIVKIGADYEQAKKEERLSIDRTSLRCPSCGNTHIKIMGTFQSNMECVCPMCWHEFKFSYDEEEKIVIDMSKKYQTVGGDTDDGEFPEPVRIVCVDGPGNYPVLGFVGDDTKSYRWTIGGKARGEGISSMHDLVEVSPWHDYKIDEPVMVNIAGGWRKRYFAGISDNGKPMTWLNGSTSWSNEWKPVEYHSVRRPTEGELK